MENGGLWKFKANNDVVEASSLTLRGVLEMLMENLNPDDPRDVALLGNGDPSLFPTSYRTPETAEEAVCRALRSGDFNGYSPTVGIPSARRAVAGHLSKDLPYDLSPDDVFLTVGCAQAIEAIVSVLANPKANILLPRPGYPDCESRAVFSHLEKRHFDLIQENDWEIDLDAVETLADENTVAMVIVSPGNPCGTVYTYDHLKKVAETARKLGILVIADEVYGHLTFGRRPFVPMGVFGSIAPIVTVGSLSKRWIVPGWRLGWLAMSDPHGVLKKQGIVEGIKAFLNISSDPATFIQGALGEILESTPDDFFRDINSRLKETAEMCYELVKGIPFLTCPSKPEGAMFLMVKLHLSMFEDIKDDTDFCIKLAKEESVIVLPGVAMGLKNWLRLMFAIEPSTLVDGLERIKAFCERHAKEQ